MDKPRRFPTCFINTNFKNYCETRNTFDLKVPKSKAPGFAKKVLWSKLIMYTSLQDFQFISALATIRDFACVVPKTVKLPHL